MNGIDLRIKPFPDLKFRDILGSDFVLGTSGAILGSDFVFGFSPRSKNQKQSLTPSPADPYSRLLRDLIDLHYPLSFSPACNPEERVWWNHHEHDNCSHRLSRWRSYGIFVTDCNYFCPAGFINSPPLIVVSLISTTALNRP